VNVGSVVYRIGIYQVLYLFVQYIANLRRNCLLKEVIEGNIKGWIEVTRRRGRRRKQLLDDLGDRRGYSHLKEEALYGIKWRNRFGRGCGPVVCQITDDDNDAFMPPVNIQLSN
jgi:hypothetical protein